MSRPLEGCVVAVVDDEFIIAEGLTLQLEDMGLATRVPNPDDARSVLIRPTAKGRRVMARGRQARVDRLTTLLEAVPAAERATVERGLRLLRDALTEVAVAE